MKKIFFNLLMLSMLTACGEPKIPAHMVYQIDPQSAPYAGTIVGYNEKSAIPLLIADDASFVYGIDSKLIQEPIKQLDTPLPIAPGPHTLDVEFRKGLYAARTSVMLNVEPGVAYRLKHISPGNVYAYRGGSVDIWIERNDTGQAVTNVVRASIDSPQSPTFVPMRIGK